MAFTRYAGSMKDYRRLVSRYQAAVNGLRSQEEAMRQGWTSPDEIGAAITAMLAELNDLITSNYMGTIGFYSDFQTIQIDSAVYTGAVEDGIRAMIADSTNDTTECTLSTPFKEIKDFLDGDNGAIITVEIFGINDANFGDIPNTTWRLKYDASNTNTHIKLNDTLVIGSPTFYAGSGIEDNASYSPDFLMSVVGVDT